MGGKRRGSIDKLPMKTKEGREGEERGLFPLGGELLNEKLFVMGKSVVFCGGKMQCLSCVCLSEWVHGWTT